MSNWISAHLFYHADAFPLLTECVTPLVAELRAQGAIDRYFFIRYWENGPHVRLRLRTADPRDDARIRRLVECRAKDFFARRPALYPLDADALQPFYKTLFIGEYGEAAFVEKYGDGPIPIDPNNSIRFIDYQPEVARYAGASGVDLAEWHFDVSSDIALGMINDLNMKVRTIQLGLAFQTLLLQSYAMWKTDERVQAFLDLYFNHWRDVVMPEPVRESRMERFDRRYAHLAAKVKRRVSHVRSLMQGQREPVDFEQTWLTHCDALVTELAHRVDRDELEFPDGANPGLVGSMEYLFPSYFHMTSNRLGVSIDDELYLTYLARRGLEAVTDGHCVEPYDLGARPRLSEAIVLGPALHRQDKVVHYAKDARASSYYCVGEREYFLLSQMNGSRTLEQLGALYEDRFGRRLGEGSWSQLLELVTARAMLDGMAAAPAATTPQQEGFRRYLRRGTFTWRVVLANPDRLLGAIVSWLRPAPVRAALLVALAAVIVNEAWVLMHLRAATSDAWRATHAGRWTLWPAVALTMYACAALHEIGHGVTLRYCGGHVPEMGVIFRYLAFFPYTKIDDVVLLTSRWHRVATALSGTFVSFVLLVPVSIVWATAPIGALARDASAVLLTGYHVSVWLNLLPFVLLDGYWACALFLNRPFLRTDARKFVWRTMQRLWQKVPSATPQYSHRDEVILFTYGLLSTAATATFLGLMLRFWDRQLRSYFGPTRGIWSALVIMGVLWFCWEKLGSKRDVSAP